MVSCFLKFSSLRDIGILDYLFKIMLNFCYASKYGGIIKYVSLALEGFFSQALMVFVSNGTVTDLFIYSSST